MSDDETPRLVVNNTEADRAREWAAERVSWTLRDMAANLLRVVRGAGKSYEIVRQTDALMKALVAYQEAVGHWPLTHDLEKMLSLHWNRDWNSHLADSAILRADAKERIVRGALQIAASRLIGQTTQERAGESEMFHGIRDLEAARAEMQREMDAARPPVRNTPSQRPKTPKG